MHLNSLKARGDEGDEPCSVATVESWDGHDQEEDMHKSAAWKNVNPRKKENKKKTN